MISVIIPVYNEEVALSHKADYYKNLAKVAELIFVDGESTDKTLEYAGRYARAFQGPKNRAEQMNLGARKARHDIFLFLHADAIVEPENIAVVEKIIKEKGCVGGCFCQCLDSSGWIYRWIAWTGNVRARVLKIFYGDQGIFVRRDVFWALGGFPSVKICEDVLFSQKLKTMGRSVVLNMPIYCSARRFRRQGVWRTFLLNLRIYLWLLFKGEPDSLARAYHDIRETI